MDYAEMVACLTQLVSEFAPLAPELTWPDDDLISNEEGEAADWLVEAQVPVTSHQHDRLRELMAYFREYFQLNASQKRHYPNLSNLAMLDRMTVVDEPKQPGT